MLEWLQLFACTHNSGGKLLEWQQLFACEHNRVGMTAVIRTARYQYRNLYWYNIIFLYYSILYEGEYHPEHFTCVTLMQYKQWQPLQQVHTCSLANIVVYWNICQHQDFPEAEKIKDMFQTTKQQLNSKNVNVLIRLQLRLFHEFARMSASTFYAWVETKTETSEEIKQEKKAKTTGST